MSERKFECIRCGNCCKEPGWVLFSDEELKKISTYLDMGLDVFMPYFSELDTVVTEDGSVLGFMMEDGCVFYEEDEGCTIYPYRPEQCKKFPYWASNESDEAWVEASKICGGIMIDTGS